MKTLLILLFPVFVGTQLFGQSPAPTVVVTTFPSLVIPASARGLSMGDAGIAASKENQQLYYNAAASAFTQNFHQASVSYLPWLSGISHDTRLMNVNYLANISDGSTLGLSLNYLQLGSLDLRDENGATLASYRAREFNIGASYALQFAAHHSLGVTLKFLGQNQFSTVPVNVYSFCGDLSYYGFMTLGSAAKKLQWGATVSNLGPKIRLPTTFGLGIGYTCISESNNQLTVLLDATRLLREDFSALRIAGGMEYSFDEQFFLRGGVSLENKNKGNRKYFSLGAGYKGFVSDQSWGLDIYYLVPFGTAAAVSPFQNGWGLTLGLSFGSFQ